MTYPRLDDLDPSLLEVRKGCELKMAAVRACIGEKRGAIVSQYASLELSQGKEGHGVKKRPAAHR